MSLNYKTLGNIENSLSKFSPYLAKLKIRTMLLLSILPTTYLLYRSSCTGCDSNGWFRRINRSSNSNGCRTCGWWTNNSNWCRWCGWWRNRSWSCSSSLKLRLWYNVFQPVVLKVLPEVELLPMHQLLPTLDNFQTH